MSQSQEQQEDWFPVEGEKPLSTNAKAKAEKDAECFAYFKNEYGIDFKLTKKELCQMTEWTKAVKPAAFKAAKNKEDKEKYTKCRKKIADTNETLIKPKLDKLKQLMPYFGYVKIKADKAQAAPEKVGRGGKKSKDESLMATTAYMHDGQVLNLNNDDIRKIVHDELLDRYNEYTLINDRCFKKNDVYVSYHEAYDGILKQEHMAKVSKKRKRSPSPQLQQHSQQITQRQQKQQPSSQQITQRQQSQQPSSQRVWQQQPVQTAEAVKQAKNEYISAMVAYFGKWRGLPRSTRFSIKELSKLKDQTLPNVEFLGWIIDIVHSKKWTKQDISDNFGGKSDKNTLDAIWKYVNIAAEGLTEYLETVRQYGDFEEEQLLNVLYECQYHNKRTLKELKEIIDAENPEQQRAIVKATAKYLTYY